LNNLLGGLAVVAVVGVVILAISIPSWRRDRSCASVEEARSFPMFFYSENDAIVDELGDTNGSYRLVGGKIGGVGQPFDFDLTFNGQTTNWSQPASNHMSFVVTIFENHRGNQFAVVRKRTEKE
jgi:hypothetical protein